MTFDEFKREELKKPQVRAEYDALEPEFSLMKAMIDARRQAGLTQSQLAERTGISQSDISKFERGGGKSVPENSEAIGGRTGNER